VVGLGAMTAAGLVDHLHHTIEEEERQPPRLVQHAPLGRVVGVVEIDLHHARDVLELLGRELQIVEERDRTLRGEEALPVDHHVLERPARERRQNRARRSRAEEREEGERRRGAGGDAHSS